MIPTFLFPALAAYFPFLGKEDAVHFASHNVFLLPALAAYFLLALVGLIDRVPQVATFLILSYDNSFSRV